MSKTTNLSKRGFTLVELLIVIVVIAILAAISIVAYNGVQNRGKASAAQSLASQVAKKAEAWNTVESTYPTLAEFKGNTGDNTADNPDTAKLDNSDAVTGTVPTDEKTVQYLVCSDTVKNVGFQVMWYNAVTGGTEAINGGNVDQPTANGAVTCA